MGKSVLLVSFLGQFFTDATHMVLSSDFVMSLVIKGEGMLYSAYPGASARNSGDSSLAFLKESCLVFSIFASPPYVGPGEQVQAWCLHYHEPCLSKGGQACDALEVTFNINS